MSDHSSILAHMLASNIDCTGQGDDGSYELHLEISTLVEFEGSKFEIEHDNGDIYVVTVRRA